MSERLAAVLAIYGFMLALILIGLSQGSDFVTALAAAGSAGVVATEIAVRLLGGRGGGNLGPGGPTRRIRNA